MTVLRVNHVAVSVSDMEASLGFYRDLLGLELVGRNPVVEQLSGFSTVVALPDFHAEWALLRVGEGGFLELMCYAEPIGQRIWDGHTPADIGMAHIALEVDDVRATWSKLIERGVETFSEPTNLGRHTTFLARGPDREILEILEERAPLPPEWRV